MKCPRCVEEGRTSKVYPAPTSITDMGNRPFYDEAGNYHLHDPNDMVTPWRCANGHTGVLRRRPPCPSCDYGHSEQVEVTNGKPA